MPAILNIANPEKKVLDANDVYLENWFTRENNAYVYLNAYNFNGSSPMVNHTWTAPSGYVFDFDTSGGFSMNGTPFSSLPTDKKVIFFRYFQKFVGECLKNYNIYYSL